MLKHFYLLLGELFISGVWCIYYFWTNTIRAMPINLLINHMNKKVKRTKKPNLISNFSLHILTFFSFRKFLVMVPQKRYSKPSQKPLDKGGKDNKCRICKSKFRWTNKCSSIIHVYMVITVKEPIPSLLAETFNIAISYSGCTKTVCAQTWLKYYLDVLRNNKKQRIRVVKSLNSSIFSNSN